MFNWLAKLLLTSTAIAPVLLSYACIALSGQIVMPIDAKDIKTLLQFLNESRYSGPMSGQDFVTNSQRPV